MRSLLAADERAKADRFRFDRHRDRYVVGRALLRLLLGRYLETAPEDVPLTYGAYDKPQLDCRGPWFNLSHSETIAAYAFTNTAEVGIDVEIYNPAFARERIAERFFSPGEVATLRSLPEAEQPRAFLRCWTRKEAFIKARGDGLNLPLESFDVSLAPKAPAALTRTAWSQAEPTSWSIEDLSDPAAGYIAALAIRSNGIQIVDRKLSELDIIEGLGAKQEDR